jgi:hypothetical protein
MNSSSIKKRIEQLQAEIQAMKNDPLLQENYKEKIMELMKLRRSQIRFFSGKGKRSPE